SVVWLRLSVLRMEVKRTFGNRLRISAVIDIPVKTSKRVLTFVGDGDARMMCIRHREITVHGAVMRDCKNRGLPRNHVPCSQSEEIPDRRFYAGRLFAIPVNTQYDAFQEKRLPIRQRKPDMGDHA